MALTLYRGATALNQLPKAAQAALAVASTAKQALSIIRQTRYYANLAMKTKRQIEQEVRSAFGSNPAPAMAPVAVGQQVVLNKPRYRAGNTNGVVNVSHREYVGEISGDTTFGVISYPINPGLGSSFPWLGGIANNYEKYRIRSLTYEFINIAATSERGRITMAVDYDVLDAVPTNKVDMFQIADAVEGPVWEPLRLKVRPSGLLFTRNGPLSGVDLKTYDAGRFIAAISNASDSTIKGELFVTYDIELHIPQSAKCPGDYGAGTVASFNQSQPFTGVVLTGGLDGFSIGTYKWLFSRPGVYLVSYYLSVSTIGTPTFITSGCSMFTASANSSTVWMSTSIVTVTVPNAYINVTWNSGAGAATTTIFAAPYNNYNN
jgi:hypothetical protein